MNWPSRSLATRSAALSTPRWCDTDANAIGNCSAISPAVRSFSVSSSRIFRRVGSARARKILELLTEKDRTAGEIAEQFPIAFASVSHHLGVLKAADLVSTEREGQFIRYRLNTTVFQEVVRYFMTRFGGGGDKNA